MRKIIAALVIAAAAVVATPMAANAEGYVPTTSVSISGSAAPGGTVSVAIGPGSFTGGESVAVAVTGAGGATLGALPVQTSSIGKTASASGGLLVSVTFPMSASGTYTMTATGASSGNIATAAFTIAPSDGNGQSGTIGGGSSGVTDPGGSTGTGSTGGTGANGGTGTTTGSTGTGSTGTVVSGTTTSGSAQVASTTRDPGNGLAFTGSTVPMLLVWSAGGAILLGGALVVVMAARRRQREGI